jgi:GH18 family chitinase
VVTYHQRYTITCIVQEWCANIWETGGATRDKLIIGMATYGRGFTLTDPGDNGLFASVSGASVADTYTQEAGFMAYYEVTSIMAKFGVCC